MRLNTTAKNELNAGVFYNGVLIKDVVLKDRLNTSVYGRIYKKFSENKHTHNLKEIYYILVFKQHPIKDNLILYKKTTSLKVLNGVLKRWEFLK